MGNPVTGTITVAGRLISRERLVKATNQKVTFYSLNTTKGWINIRPDKNIDMSKVEVPGLVEVVISSIKVNEVTLDDGRQITNKNAYAVSIKNIEHNDEFLQYEQKALEDKWNQ